MEIKYLTVSGKVRADGLMCVRAQTLARDLMRAHTHAHAVMSLEAAMFQAEVSGALGRSYSQCFTDIINTVSFPNEPLKVIVFD